ncbi:MAG: ABC transporter ATP-binding protein [Candidatus Latescibacterota bacterium]|nr:MAG: ABC transporter ATP-binding protein [Candidatus Latescibacterota bacterium]
MSIIEFNNIHRAYKRGIDVLRGVSFSLEKGEVVGLLGKNGAGKTTLMRIAMGMIEPQKGIVSLFGLGPRDEPIQVKRRVGYVSEDQILPEFLRVREVIQLHRGLFPTWDEALEHDLCKRFSLPLNAKIRSLSKGQARQVALLCAVSHRPELLLLDEPAGGLDPAARREFLETSIQMLNETGTTILFSSHYMSDVERLAGRVVMIHEGGVLIDSDIDLLREGHSLVLVPHAPKVTRDALLSIEGCIGVRDRSDAMHAVFRCQPRDALDRVARQFGSTGARHRDVALEEMFIELVGGQS